MDKRSNRYEQNCQFLNRHNGALYVRYQAHKTIFPRLPLKRVPSKSGLDSLVIADTNGDIPLHSLYDPRREAVQKTKEACAGDNIFGIVVFGLGLGYHFEELVKCKRPEQSLIVIEPSWHIFEEFLHATVLDDPALFRTTTFIVGQTGERFSLSFHAAVYRTLPGRSAVVALDGESRYFAELFAVMQEGMTAVQQKKAAAFDRFRQETDRLQERFGAELPLRTLCERIIAAHTGTEPYRMTELILLDYYRMMQLQKRTVSVYDGE